MEKVCTKCHTIKDYDDFHNDKSNPTGKKPCCKLCTKKYYESTKIDKLAKNKIRYQNNRDNIRLKAKIKYKEDRYKYKATRDKWNKNNAEHIKKKRLENSDKNKEYSKEWRSKNLNHSNEHKKKYLREKKATNTSFAIECRLRSRVCRAIKSDDSFKSKPTKQLLGCSINSLKLHLQKTAEQNYPDISFDIDSYSGKEFHIDHIKPCSSFDLSDKEQQLECFNWSNLQILKSLDNLKKSDKIHE